MATITIVFTVHNEQGLCNQAELVRILREIDPEVIFEELRPLDFAEMYQESARHTLEMKAIIEFRNEKPVEQVPVDHFEMKEGLAADINKLLSYAERSHTEYGEFTDKEDWCAYHFGFEFFCSAEFKALNAQTHKALSDAVDQSKDEAINGLLQDWNQRWRMRERSMVENIYKYSERRAFSSAAFLVGAGHIAGILEEIATCAKENPEAIEWKIWKRA